MTGFLALDEEGHVATLGRNGSDLTAVWIGEAVGAEEVHLWKTVDGIHSADPRLVPGAQRIDQLDYATAAELALQGAEVLHPAAMEPARRSGLPIRVRGVHDPDSPGTRIAPPAAIAWGGGPAVLALAHRRAAPAAGPEGELASFALVGPGLGSDPSLVAEVVELARGAGLSARPRPAGDGAGSRAFVTSGGDLAQLLRLVHGTFLSGLPHGDRDPGRIRRRSG